MRRSRAGTKTQVAPRSWALLSGHTPGNRLDWRVKPGEGGYSRCALCPVHSVLRTPLDGWSDRTPRKHRRDEGPSGTPLVSRWDGSLHRHRRDAPICAVGDRGLTAMPRTVIADVKLTVETTKIETTTTTTTATILSFFVILPPLPLPLPILVLRPLLLSLLPAVPLAVARLAPLTPAAWNVCSILDNPRSNRPERRTALVARELARYKVDIAAHSEIRFSEQGQLEEVGAGYTFFWSDRPRAERRDAGVAFAIRNDIVGRLPCLSHGINDRLMSLRLPLRRGGKFATIISAHARQ
ncbi:hypothetical protein SprV_0401627300 [Sparganum proliferum]